MPGGLNGQNLKQALISAAPLFSSMAAGYSSGRGPYAYLDQGIAGMQAMQKQKRDEEAAAAAAAAFGGLVPGGMGPAGGAASAAASGAAARGGSAPITFDKSAPQYIADDAMAALGKDPLSMEGRIREGLKARGLPEHVANGFIANFKDESNLNPGINEASPVVPGSRGGFGLAQWTGPRRKALEAFAASQGKPVDDLDVQLDFLMTELSGSEAGAGAAIMSAKNAPEAAAAIVNNFLRPAEQHRASREAEYLGMDAGAPTQADPLADPYVQKLMQVMAMPGLTPEQRSVVELQLQTRMGQLTAPDPNAEEDRARERRARDAELLGYGRGTPEWNQYVVTGEVPKGPTPTDDMREYDMAKSQGYTGTFQQYQIDMKKAGATNVTTTVGGGPSDDKLRGKLMEKEGELWSTYLQTGATSAGTVQDMAALDELIKVAPQGPVTGRLAEVFPGFSSAGDAFQSIVKRVAPTLRAPGSGATSDIEYDGMLRSLPALRNSPEANAAIAAMMKAKASLNVERARVIEEYQNGAIEAPEARKRMAELDKRSIMSPEVAAILGVDAPADSASSQAGGVPDGIDPADWQAMTPEERALWSN